MTPLKHVLAATDLSAPARHAAERAALLARETGATLDVLHVARPEPLERLRRLAGGPEALEQRVLEATREELGRLAAALLCDCAVTAHAEVLTGALLTEVARQADARSADLIVLGARGSSYMRHLLLGSTAERLLGRTTRPMLVVKQAARWPYRTVLVPVDFSAASLPALRLARAVGPKARMVVLHAYEVPFEGKLQYAGVDAKAIEQYRVAAQREAQQKLQTLFQEAGWLEHDAKRLVLHGNPLRHILEQEQEQECDLIVVGKQGESRVEDMLLGSVTRHVLTQSGCDVLVSV